MAKTKFQKQHEAIERKRKEFSEIYSSQWVHHQVGGRYYQDYLKRFGEEYAKKQMDEFNRSFVKKAREAHVDAHGNPLD